MNVVVVGHGSSPVGKGWGIKIDSCDVVVRMWNWQPWQDVHDYGVKYDYGFYEILPAEMARFYKHNCRTPTLGWIAALPSPHQKRYDGELPPESIKVDPVPWEQEATKMGGVGTKGRIILTRGCRAACWIIGTMFKGQTLVLVGFDNMVAGIGLPIKEGFPDAYVACPATFPFRDYTGGKRRYGNHDYGIEGPLLKTLAERAGITMVQAQEVW